MFLPLCAWSWVSWIMVFLRHLPTQAEARGMWYCRILPVLLVSGDLGKVKNAAACQASELGLLGGTIPVLYWSPFWCLFYHNVAAFGWCSSHGVVGKQGLSVCLRVCICVWMHVRAYVSAWEYLCVSLPECRLLFNSLKQERWWYKTDWTTENRERKRYGGKKYLSRQQWRKSDQGNFEALFEEKEPVSVFGCVFVAGLGKVQGQRRKLQQRKLVYYRP